MGISGVTKYDQYLTDLALSYPTGNLIGEIVCPIKPVTEYSDYVFQDADDAIALRNDEAEAVPANMVDFGAGDAYSYRTRRKAFSDVVRDKEANSAAKVVRWKQRVTNKLVHRLKLKHEYRVATILTDPTKITQTTDVDAVANARLDETTPTLETDIITAVTTIQSNCGAVANTIIIPFKAAVYAAKVSFIKDTLKYDYGMEYVQASFQNQVMAAVGLPPFIKGLRVVVSAGRKDNSNKGETTNPAAVWGKDILIGYVPPNVEVDDMFGILTMEYESLKVWTERQSDPRGTKIVAEWDYDIMEANLASWYLLQNVVG